MPLDKVHKHIPEMQAYAALDHSPQFVPSVGAFACGMRVEVPIHSSLLPGGTSAEGVWQTLADRYEGEPFVQVAPFTGLAPVDDFAPWILAPSTTTNSVRLHVFENPAGHLLLVGILDNLGKGASGVAIQSLNLMLGLGETTGLPA